MLKQNKPLFAAMIIAVFMLAIIITGCDAPASPSATTVDPQQTTASAVAAAGTMHVTVYYATADAMNLSPEVHVVPKTTHPAEDAVALLLQDPQSHDLVRVFPEGTKLRGISIKDNIAYVDFNDKFAKNSGEGSNTEMLIVASVVDTLTEFADIQKVQILVEGKNVETLSHMDISEPLSRSEKIIKKHL